MFNVCLSYLKVSIKAVEPSDPIDEFFNEYTIINQPTLLVVNMNNGYGNLCAMLFAMID